MKMDYARYVKGDYMKMALKGKAIPFSEKWESAAVGVQCIFAINSNMNQSAAKLIEGIPDDWETKFSNGEPLEYDNRSKTNIELFLRSQAYLKTISSFLEDNLPPIMDIIMQNKEKIDIGIYKYIVGNKSVLENFANEALNQVNAIDNSIQASFKDNLDDIAELKRNIAYMLDKIPTDLQRLVDKFSNPLGLDNILKVEQ